MKTGYPRFVPSPFRGATLFAAALTLAFGLRLWGQQPTASPIADQHAAMQKLSFLTGRWSGPVTVVSGPGEPLHLVQTEDVEYKLDGLVLLIQGRSTDSAGKVAFSALATIAYDEASHTYRIRAYNGGHYLDSELSVPANGFAWGFAAGPAHIMNTMQLTGKGEWSEVTEVTVGGNPPHRSVEMLLHRMP